MSGAKVKEDSSHMHNNNARWSVNKAQDWYESQPWLIGCNYIPAYAVNQLEMWQKNTFDPHIIASELQLAQSIGLNVLRVYLHDLLWSDGVKAGFIDNINTFLDIAYSHHMRAIFVLFDDCHRRNPALGRQPPPVRGVHNSRWMQSPGSEVVEMIHNNKNMEELIRLKAYVKGVLTYYNNDTRILMWDLYNEPGMNDLEHISLKLLQHAWRWAHEVRPNQPMTSCLDGSRGEKNIKLNMMMSDIITFHWYDGYTLEAVIDDRQHQSHGRPLICTEYMAREIGTTFQHTLPLFKAQRIGAVSWGLVAGKTQTNFNWESLLWLESRIAAKDIIRDGDKPIEPQVWFHDIFRIDGSPYDKHEIDFIKMITNTTDVM